METLEISILGLSRMKALAIFNAVAAVKIFRMQSNRDGNQHVIKPANAEPIVKKDSDYEGASAVGNFLLPEEAFKFTLTCNGLTKANCEQAQQILEKAGREIAQVINFKKPINVNATFSPFCPNNGKCAISGRLGQASPSCKYGSFS